MTKGPREPSRLPGSVSCPKHQARSNFETLFHSRAAVFRLHFITRLTGFSNLMPFLILMSRDGTLQHRVAVLVSRLLVRTLLGDKIPAAVILHVSTYMNFVAQNGCMRIREFLVETRLALRNGWGSRSYQRLWRLAF